MKRLATLLWMLLMSMAMSSGEAVAAGKYSWLEGKGSPVCQAYKSYVESIEDPTGRGGIPWSQKLMCARAVPKEHAPMSGVVWNQFDPRSKLDLAVTIAYLASRGVDRQRLAMRPKRPVILDPDEQSKWLDSSRDAWALADIDVDNDGVPERVVKYKHGRCSDIEPDVGDYAVWLFVLDRSSNDIDIEKTRQVQRLKSTADLSIASITFDAFRFRDLTYIDSWDSGPVLRGAKPRLTVFVHRGAETQALCKFEYQAE